MNNDKLAVLDNGYVQLIESWGTGLANEPEAAIIEAARQSTQGSFRGWEKDKKLLAFMFNNKHSTPFEFCGMTIEVQAPIIVFREWQRHRTQSYNEMSARYAPLPDINYIPNHARLFMTQATNVQAQATSDSDTLTVDSAHGWQLLLQELYTEAERVYQKGLQIGIPKEIARLCVPVGRYSRMRATANLRNWLAFLTLRMNPNAQFEIREFAHVVGLIIAKEFPRTWKLFNNE